MIGRRSREAMRLGRGPLALLVLVVFGSTWVGLGVLGWLAWRLLGWLLG